MYCSLGRRASRREDSQRGRGPVTHRRGDGGAAVLSSRPARPLHHLDTGRPRSATPLSHPHLTSPPTPSAPPLSPSSPCLCHPPLSPSLCLTSLSLTPPLSLLCHPPLWPSLLSPPYVPPPCHPTLSPSSLTLLAVSRSPSSPSPFICAEHDHNQNGGIFKFSRWYFVFHSYF